MDHRWHPIRSFGVRVLTNTETRMNCKLIVGKIDKQNDMDLLLLVRHLLLVNRVLPSSDTVDTTMDTANRNSVASISHKYEHVGKLNDEDKTIQRNKSISEIMGAVNLVRNRPKFPVVAAIQAIELRPAQTLRMRT